MKYYKIGNIIWCPEDSISLIPDSFMELFAVPAAEVPENTDIVYYKGTEYTPDAHPQEKLLTKEAMYELWKSGGDMLLFYYWHSESIQGFCYSLNELTDSDTVTCYFNPAAKGKELLTDTRFFSNAGMHTKLLQHDAAVLHASYIDVHGRAVLFTAPSQTGKSTQAALWEKFAGAEIINGDRVLVREADGVWHAFGYPCCGSSRICLNRTLPIAAIVVLEQGADNAIVPLSVSAKIRSLVSATEVFVWSEWEVDKAFSLAEGIIGSVPVFKLSCTPDVRAVETLQKYLEEIL